LRGVPRTILSVMPRGWEARAAAIVVPTRSAAEELRRTVEDLILDRHGDAAVLLPDLVTRSELYLNLHARLGDAPALLTEFEREVLLRLAADDARAQGVEAPFRLRPGLLAAVLGFYDELRRRGRSIDTFDRLVRERLEPGSESDRGASRLLRQTDFLSSTFAAFERRVADSGRIDEHALRALLLSSPLRKPYRHIILCVGDQAADPRGLWPADFDLLTRIPGLLHLDVVATERALAAGFQQRLHDTLPGMDEDRPIPEALPPALIAPAAPERAPSFHFVCRDREEELVDAARWIRHRARQATRREEIPALHRTAVVFQRPLPYLYLARQVLGSAKIPYQAADALPLAAEPMAAAIDLIFAVVNEEATRASLVELMASAQWSFTDPADPDRPIDRHQTAALDRVLQQSKYLGGWERLRHLAGSVSARTASATREAALWRRAAPAIAAAAAACLDLEAVATAPTASAQIDRLLGFVAQHERPPGETDPGHERHARARGAILGALAALRGAHEQFDDRPQPVGELIATIRRWIEGQTFAPRAGQEGVLLLDAAAAAFADVDEVRLVGLVEADWPNRAGTSIFYPASLLKDLGWAAEAERIAAARAQFQDLLFLAHQRVAVSSFTLEEDALIPPSPFLDDLPSSGLVLQRPEAPPATRIFAHEALAMSPVVPDAIAGSPRAWLQMRLERTAAGDPRYRGAVGARQPEAYAVSRIERYLACPFKYFSETVLKLDEEREDESGLTPQERGQLLHGVFEAFFTEWRKRGGTTITTQTLDAAVTLFADVAASLLQGLPEADRALERTYLLGSAASPGLAERAFAFEIEHGVGVVERLIEYEFDGSFRFEGAEGVRDVRLRGKADRIDLLTDGTVRVIDYKLGRAPKPARVLQLPIYGVCAEQQLAGYRGRTWTLGRAGYVAFREKNPFVELRGRSGSLEEALRDGQQRLLTAVEQIEAGEFPVSPDEPWTCTRCGFSHVCRKDYVGDE
jgi:ATP-dependent helicase/nuclease subunit B